MKISRVYFFALLFFGFLLLSAGSGCARGSGCDNLKDSKVKLTKDGMPRKKSRTALFGKKMRRN